MQMSELKISILPPVEGRGPHIIQPHRKRDAASVTGALKKAYGAGIMKDPERDRVSPDPELQLKPGHYTYTLGKPTASEALQKCVMTVNMMYWL